jgi:hypothetical protein
MFHHQIDAELERESLLPSKDNHNKVSAKNISNSTSKYFKFVIFIFSIFSIVLLVTIQQKDPTTQLTNNDKPLPNVQTAFFNSKLIC